MGPLPPRSSRPLAGLSLWALFVFSSGSANYWRLTRAHRRAPPSMNMLSLTRPAGRLLPRRPVFFRLCSLMAGAVVLGFCF
ncbi:unnamed protein product [Amoebophrya sp. A25]|nr:unnamed protein product [Amoebophrya sp. A25]CAD7967899.1 unnamed protein product [Amoebophrya sp. A25]|eukprot:GSA25T00021400001.1